MLILKRLAVWSMETACQVPLLMAILFLLSDPGEAITLWVSEPHEVFGLWGVRFLLFATAVFMIGSGYLVTTAIIGVFFRSETPWVYSAIAALLFVIHGQLFLAGWELPTPAHVRLQVIGAGAVFACTFVGGRLLRKWSTKR